MRGVLWSLLLFLVRQSMRSRVYFLLLRLNIRAFQSDLKDGPGEIAETSFFFLFFFYTCTFFQNTPTFSLPVCPPCHIFKKQSLDMTSYPNAKHDPLSRSLFIITGSPQTPLAAALMSLFCTIFRWLINKPHRMCSFFHCAPLFRGIDRCTNQRLT